MKRVGEILKEKRVLLNKTIEEVSQEIKVREEYLRAIEKGEYQDLPGDLYLKGFISTYARALGLDQDQVMPFYRREHDDKDPVSIRKVPVPLSDSKIKITPKRILVLVVSLILTAFLLVLFFQYRNYAGVPVLIIDFPPDNLSTTQDNVEIIGKTDPEARLTVNGEDVTPAVNGSFSLSVRLNEGINRIKIVAVSSLGKENITERVVEKRMDD